jgi:hypothetical protein
MSARETASDPFAPTANEASRDVGFARHRMLEWLSNSQPVYEWSQKLADLSPTGLGIMVVAVLYGDAERDFEPAAVQEAAQQVRYSRPAAGLLDTLLAVPVGGMRDFPDQSTNEVARYAADELARKDVAGIDWEELATDLYAGGEQEPTWLRERREEEHDCDACTDPACTIGMCEFTPEERAEAEASVAKTLADLRAKRNSTGESAGSTEEPSAD